MSTKISNFTELTAADLAALDLDLVVDASAGTSGTKKMYAISKALGLSKLLFFEDTGGDDAYVISTELTLAALSNGFAFALKPTTGNTGACTLTVDSVAAKSIKVVDASGVRDPLTGEIAAGMTALLSYNGTYFILLNPALAVTPKRIVNFSKTGAPISTGTVLNVVGTSFAYLFAEENYRKVKMWGITQDSSDGPSGLPLKETVVSIAGGGQFEVKHTISDDRVYGELFVDSVSVARTEGYPYGGTQSETFVCVEFY